MELDFIETTIDDEDVNVDSSSDEEVRQDINQFVILFEHLE